MTQEEDIFYDTVQNNPLVLYILSKRLKIVINLTPKEVDVFLYNTFYHRFLLLCVSSIINKQTNEKVNKTRLNK